MTNSTQTEAPAVPTLRRSLSLTDLSLLSIGTVIGSGIFLVPSVVLRQSGLNSTLALLIWVLGGILSLLGALTYAELGAMHPEAGGLYVYIRDAFGPLPAFLYGWASFFMIASGSIATLAVAFGKYLSQILPIGPAEEKLVAIALIAATMAVNISGVRKGATVQNVSTALKLIGLVGLSVAMIALGHQGKLVSPLAASGPGESTVRLGAAMIGVLWAYEGWQYVTFAAGEAADPQRTFPRAIALSTLGLIIIYLLANIGYLSALGAGAAGQSDHIAVDAVRVVVGSAAGTIVGTLILVSIFSAANGLMLTAPRLYYSMARDGVFFERLAHISPRLGTPARAIVAIAAWSAILALSGTFEQLLTYVVFTGWIFYGLGGLSVFVLRRTQPDIARPFRVPGYPITPVLFVSSAALLVFDTVRTQPVRALIGIGIVIIGAPAYYLWRRASALDLPESDPSPAA